VGSLTERVEAVGLILGGVEALVRGLRDEVRAQDPSGVIDEPLSDAEDALTQAVGVIQRSTVGLSVAADAVRRSEAAEARRAVVEGEGKGSGDGWG
jgi:hypothetical protein